MILRNLLRKQQNKTHLKNKENDTMSKNIKNLNLSSPWTIFYREIQAMFGKDPDIKISYDEDAYVIKLYVTGTDKANALSQLLPVEKEFGNVVLKIIVIPANNEVLTDEELFNMAFAGNPVFDYAVHSGGDTIVGNNTYVVFKKEVVQYFNDSLNDLHGLCSTLHQEIAKDVFGTKTGLYYCTNIEAEA